ncbi:NmrA-domain-containing protein [Venturia nashicola]|uniref:NmrA-domain-containing protein n=1 Tax=Venturia nashicola TaxID=86259 RepID=A0A4Z1NRI3_9PEZI|nr:NmrA-domain-containing protein [Venturia nashicola]
MAMGHQTQTVVVVNASGRQGASFVRVASAVGWQVRAHMKDRVGIVAQDICARDNVTIIEGTLTDPSLVNELFKGQPHLAFINTVTFGDEFAIGKALADAAQRAGVKHLIYSSMPDHAVFGKGWKTMPQWGPKAKIESYLRQLDIPTTFVYAGIYHNNFSSLPYPLFRMELQDDGSFEWQAPFRPNKRLPWLDAEHDVGPVLLQIFKQGPRQWANKRVPLAFQYLTPIEVCEAFSRALQQPVYYSQGPIQYLLPQIPRAYREHLDTLQEILGKKDAPYFGPEMEEGCTQIASELWEGNRDIEEYAREVFPIEEYNNGLRWMDEEESDQETPNKFQGSC